MSNAKEMKSNNKKKIIIGACAVVIVAVVAVIAIVLSRPEKSVATTNSLVGVDVLCEPSGITVTPDGAFLITDVYSKLIRRVENEVGDAYAGDRSTADLYGRPLGGYNDALRGESLFKEPWAITPFLDGYAVSDTENNAVRLIRNDGTQTVNASSDELEMGDLGVVFDKPTGLTTDDEGNLYIAETGTGKILKVSEEGDLTVEYEGLERPMGICYNNGYIYIAETDANRIVRIKDGKLDVVAGSGDETADGSDGNGPAMQATFICPQGVAVGPDGSVYVGDTAAAQVRKVSPDGNVTTIFSRNGNDLELYPVSPRGMYVYNGFLYVCDYFARQVFVFPL